MRIRIRIYMEKEPELYALYKAAGPALTRKIFKQSVEAYVTGADFNISLPPVQIIDTPKLMHNPMFDFTVSDECQNALQNLPARSLTTFVKALVRYYTFWALTDSFNVPHVKQQMMQSVQQTSSESVQEKPKPAKSKIIQPEFSQPKPAKVVNSDEKVDVMDNSDVNSLAALFGSIKTR